MTLTIKDATYFLTTSQWDAIARPNPPDPSDDQKLLPGTVVEYLGHIPGGAVKVRHQGNDVVVDPLFTVELS